MQFPSSRSTEPDFEAMCEHFPQPVLLVDRTEEIIFANQAANRAFRMPPLGAELSELFPTNLRRLRNLDTVVFLRLKAVTDVEYEASLTPFGEDHVLISLTPVTSGVAIAPDEVPDDLTGLLKRGAVMKHLEAMSGSDGRDTYTAVHCLDLDRFKMVNDTLGHGIGDMLLSKVADRMRSACRRDDIVARIGGDEFVILQPGVSDPSDAEVLAARLVDLVGRTYVLNGHTVNIGVSVGFALRRPRQQPRDILRDADLALYAAKQAGRGRYRAFEIGMDASLHERRELEIDMRRALALKQFRLHYQPFIDVTTNEVIGFEALLRWQHPVRGNVPPLKFIPLSEETGLIVKIGEWVLRAACMAAASWPEDLIVAVNVSPMQFKSDTLLETVKSALDRAGLPAHRLEIEITEGALLDNTRNVLEVLHSLRDLGVKISMDDFGTGYSSLSYLQKFPFHKIKIDRSFIQTAGQDGDGEAILKAVAGLGSSLGMAITAEGVETAEQLTRIRNERCTHVQGYFTGRPMEAGNVLDFLTSNQSKEETIDGTAPLPASVL